MGTIASVPFVVATSWSVLDGVVRFQDSTLVIEFREKKWLGLIEGAIRSIAIPIEQLAGVELDRGLLGATLIVRVHDLCAFVSIPWAQGNAEVQLSVSKKHIDDAVVLAQNVALEKADRLIR
jgi:hypothetical protein